ncbi:MAG: ELWxxDGT repeat protein [Thermoanaerobaculia bacterium]
MPTRRLALPFAAALLGSLLALAATAQPAYMVADLGSATQWHGGEYFSLPQALAVGGLLYFFEDDGVHGRELWRSDGTALGTFLVLDICKGSCGSRNSWQGLFADLGGTLLFVANDGVHGLELWRSDGTALGTSLVTDLEPGYGSSQPHLLTSAAGQVFFVAWTEARGTGLWRTDGTPKGTYAVSPNPPDEAFSPTALYAAADLLFLCDVSGATGSGLWRSDGTTAGTQFLAPVSCGPNLFSKRATLATLSDGDLIFNGADAAGGAELWRSDGTPAGTFRVADLVPGTGSSSPQSFAKLGNEILFVADTGPAARELWETDGTPGGTVPISLPAGAEPLSGSGFWAVAGDRYYFAGFDDAHGVEPWVYEGGTAGLIIDLVPGPVSSLTGSYFSGPILFADSLGELIFVGNDGVAGPEFWRSDGSAAGTTRISDITPDTTPFQFPTFWNWIEQPKLADRLLAIEFQPATGYRLWRLAPGGTSMQLLRAIDSQDSGLEPLGKDRASLIDPAIGRICFGPTVGKLYFELGADPDADYGYPRRFDLWSTDGSEAGTNSRLQGWPSTRAEDCQVAGDRLLFSGGENNARQLLAVAPEVGEEVIATLSPDSNAVDGFLPFEGSVYFSVGPDLWRSDGTVAGSNAIASGIGGYGARLDSFSGEILSVAGNVWLTSEVAPSGAVALTNFNGPVDEYAIDAAGLLERVVLVAYEASHGAELWVSDGTEGSAALLADIRPGPADAFPRVSIDTYATFRERRFGATESYAAFAANDGSHGSELWVTDGTALGTGLLRDIYPGDYPSTPRQFTRLGARVVFSAEDEEHGLELWVTDGTYPGTALLKDIAPGLASSVPDDLVVRDGVLYFSAWSPNYGREAWKSDGTSGGTMRISDIAPGPLSSSPQRFARAGNRLYFSATDQVHGYELWAISDDGSLPLFLDGFESSDTARWSAAIPSL